jgi:signal recognition particle subunit SRP14
MSVFTHSYIVTHEQEYAPTESEDTFADLHPDRPLPVIVRASNGKSKRDRSDKVKLSTIVEPHYIEEFYLRYADICKAGMTALKPRDRSKNKAKAKAKKKKAAA